MVIGFEKQKKAPAQHQREWSAAQSGENIWYKGDTAMELISLLSGPVVGAVIGYFTNYIAVKMLFHPRNPITVGEHTLPFTPGIIPKRKKDLAKAIGRAVQDELFGEQEVKEILLAEDTREVIIEGIANQLNGLLCSETSVKQQISALTGQEFYEEKKAALEHTFTDKIVQGITSMDIGQIIADKGTVFIGEKMNNPLLSMFMTPELIQSLAVPIGEQVNAYLETEGREKIQVYVQDEIEALEQKKTGELLIGLNGHGLVFQEKIQQIYGEFVEAHADKVAKQFKVQEIIESRIAGMSNEALEQLVLSVMKNELGMIVNLGALIGAIIGIVNVFI